MKLILVSMVVLLLASSLALSNQASMPNPNAEKTEPQQSAKLKSNPAFDKNSAEDNSVLQELFTSQQLRENPHLIKAITNGFPVSANALGDMNQDGIINILDLIRIRNIHLGVGAPPSSYEFVEGDLNQDHVLDSKDIRGMLDVLLWKAGIPCLIGSSGGTIVDRGVEISISPGTIDTSNVFRVTHLSPRYLEEKYNIDISQEEADSNWVMAGFRFESSKPTSFAKSSELTIRLDSLPPCSLRGLNALYEITPDVDGDGKSEIAYEGLMIPTPDSLGLALQVAGNPTIEAIGNRRLGTISMASMGVANGITFYVGERLRISGMNLSSSCSMHFIDKVGGMQTVVPFIQDSLGWYTIVPPHPTNPEAGGDVELQIEDMSNYLTSGLVAALAEGAISLPGITILWSPIMPSNPDSLIDDYFSTIDSLATRARDNLLASTAFDTEDKTALLNGIDKALQRLPMLRDTILTVPIEIRYRIASMIQQYNEATRGSESFHWAKYAPQGCREDCREILDEMLKKETVCFFIGVIMAANPLTLAIFPVVEVVCLASTIQETIDWGICRYNCDEIWDPCPGGTMFYPDTRKDHFCPNIFGHRGKVCIANTWGTFPGRGWPSHGEYLRDGQVAQLSVRSCCGSALSHHPLEGAIVHANMRLPFGAVAIINGAGGFELPGIPPNSTITLGIYDPRTGLSDQNVASFVTGNDLDQHKIYSPFVFYNPDTSVYDYPLRVGEPATAAISASMPRITYHLNIDSNKSIRFKFWSQEPLTLWIQNASGQFIFRDSLAACGDAILNLAGTYKVTVTYGLDGGKGDFELGAAYSSSYPITHLCGNVSGLLAQGLAPFYLLKNAIIPSGDSLIIDMGTQLVASPGAELLNDGNIDAVSGQFEIVNNLSVYQGQGATFTSHSDTLRKIIVRSGGILSHERGVLEGVRLVVDTLVIDSGGSIDVRGRGYRGTRLDGWGEGAETYPGYLGATAWCGGSHGGSGGIGSSGGSAGDVYGSVEEPNELGAGSSAANGLGADGGGLVRIEADVLVMNGGVITADGSSPCAAGGSVNIRARKVSGTGEVRANGGNGGPWAGGGGGGRIAIRWQEGDISGWTVRAEGGAAGNSTGGAGTIYTERTGSRIGQRR